MKNTRTVDLQLLKFVRTLPCLACCQRPTDAHHVTSRGAGGGDTPENLMPLCRIHHMEWHSQGPTWMSETYPVILNWIAIAHREDVLEKGKTRSTLP